MYISSSDLCSWWGEELFFFGFSCRVRIAFARSPDSSLASPGCGSKATGSWRVGRGRREVSCSGRRPTPVGEGLKGGEDDCRSRSCDEILSSLSIQLGGYRVRQRPVCFTMGGYSARDGTLSLDGFKASAMALIERWKEIEVDDSLPDWTWKPCCKLGVPSEVEGYLALEGVYRNLGGSQIEESNDFDGADVIGDDIWVPSSSDDAHVYDFHVVYSHSYRVPMLYFRGHLAGGQLLTLDEIKQDLPSDSLKVLNESKWTFITREEHPHLSRPWFTLHPCATSDWMKLLLDETKVADKEQSLQYIPAWLSVVGQAAGLKIPLELHCNS